MMQYKTSTKIVIPAKAGIQNFQNLLKKHWIPGQARNDGFFADANHVPEGDWPAKRDLAMLKKWFDVEFHSAVLDLVDAPLKDDD